MTRLGSLVLCSTLGVAVSACGNGGSTSSTGKTALQLVPLGNDVSGWSVDESLNQSPGDRAMIGNNETEVGHLIDGAGYAFYTPPYTPKQFAFQNYVNSSLVAPDPAEIVLYILQMPSADQASGLYSSLLEKGDYAARADGWSATTPVLGTESRIQDDITKWWINFHQDVFYVEVKLTPSAGPKPDYTPSDPGTKKEAIRFAQAIASKL
jgi:hypothetical protein